MNNQRTMERKRDENLVVVDDGNDVDESNEVDSEWADFENFLKSIKQRRISTTSSIDEELQRSKKHSKVKSQAFYPCPPTMEYTKDSDSSSSDDDPFGYVDTIVRIFSLSFSLNLS